MIFHADQMWENEECDLKKKLLEGNRLRLNGAFLLDDIPRFYAYLRQCKVLDITDTEQMDRLSTSHERVNKFIDLLIKRCPHGFDHFIEAMMKERIQRFQMIAEEMSTAFIRQKSVREQNRSIVHEDLDGLVKPGDQGGPPLPSASASSRTSSYC